MQLFDVTFLMMIMVAVFGIFLLLFVASGIKVLKEWDRAAVLRLGKFLGIRGPGIIWIMPILDKVVVIVSLRIQQTKIDTGNYTTNDGSKNRLTGYVNWRVIDVQKAVLGVENYLQSVFNIIQHTVLKICQSFPGETVMMDEELLNTEIQKEMEPTLTSWGIKIIEIKLKSTSEWG